MRVLRFAAFGEPSEVLALETAPEPSLASGEVRVRLTHWAIHPSDLMNVRGTYGLTRPPLPRIGGNDGAGVVTELGPGTHEFDVGDRVVLRLGALKGEGSWREEVCLPDEAFARIPKNLDDAGAGALWDNYMSSWAIATDVLTLGHGDWVLQTAAGSQFASAVRETAKLLGFDVLNVVRRSEQAAELRAEGVEHVIATADGDLNEQVRSIVPDGVTYAVDAVAGATTGKVLESLALGGTLVLIGALDTGPMPLPSATMLFRGLTVKPFWLTPWIARIGRERHRAAVARILHHVEHGDFVPAIDSTYPLSDFATAVCRAETPGRRGAVVLVPGPVSV